MMIAKKIQKELKKHATKKRAVASAWFFKTGKGQYGEGDMFIGVTNPVARSIAFHFIDISLPELLPLLYSKVHEDRFVALEILVAKYEKGDKTQQKKIVSFYIKHKARVNNWDLVDTSASYILGRYLFDKNKKVLYKLAKSKSTEDNRTYTFG